VFSSPPFGIISHAAIRAESELEAAPTAIRLPTRYAATVSSASEAALRRAADLLAEGDWQAAHTIVQDDSSAVAAWLHGIVHLLEGDASNARYWYGQAGRPLSATMDVRAEIDAARDATRRSRGP